MDLVEASRLALGVKERYRRLYAERHLPSWGLGEYVQGFVVDVGDLVRLFMAHQGTRPQPNARAELRHELADCLYSLLVLADEAGIDISAAFRSTMSEIEARLSTQISDNIDLSIGQFQ
jgi:hypothetical protein